MFPNRHWQPSVCFYLQLHWLACFAAGGVWSSANILLHRGKLHHSHSSCFSVGGITGASVARRRSLCSLCAKRAPTWCGTARRAGTTTRFRSGRSLFSVLFLCHWNFFPEHFSPQKDESLSKVLSLLDCHSLPIIAHSTHFHGLHLCLFIKHQFSPTARLFTHDH